MCSLDKVARRDEEIGCKYLRFLFTFRRFDLEAAGSANIRYFLATCRDISFFAIILKKKNELKTQTSYLRII